jgi:F-type H+-transporting ATPase subunit b
MRNDFGINTDIFETNIINLAVVVGVVVKVVGGSLSELLDKRRRTILLILQEADQKARESQKRLEEAQKVMEKARVRAQEIRVEASRLSESLQSSMQQRLREDLQYLREGRKQSLQIQRQRMIKSISQQVIDLAFVNTEETLLKCLVTQETSRLKQQELNEAYIEEILLKLEK